MNDEPIILSEEGRRRQEQILRVVLEASKGRKRRATLSGATQICLLLTVLLSVLYWQMCSSNQPRPRIVHVAPNPVVHSDIAPTIVVKRIETDPNILQRLSLPPITSTVRHIGDAELMRELADAHQSAGLISVNGKAELIFR